jgi:hypothetical protein
LYTAKNPFCKEPKWPRDNENRKSQISNVHFAFCSWMILPKRNVLALQKASEYQSGIYGASHNATSAIFATHGYRPHSGFHSVYCCIFKNPAVAIEPISAAMDLKPLESTATKLTGPDSQPLPSDAPATPAVAPNPSVVSYNTVAALLLKHCHFSNSPPSSADESNKVYLEVEESSFSKHDNKSISFQLEKPSRMSLSGNKH